MAVTVVRGLIRDNQPDHHQQADPTRLASKGAAAALTQVQQAANSVARNSEAVQVSVRNARAAGTPDRVADPKQARELAEKLSDTIRKDGESSDAHSGIERSGTRATLV